MSPDTPLTLLLIGAVGALAAALWRSYELGQQMDRLDHEVQDSTALGQSQAGRIAALENLRDTQQITEHAVAAGTAVVREVHKGIASVPFGILESIPTTRESAKVVRQIHDAVSDSVYGAISGLNKAVGRELRKAIPLDQPTARPVEPAPPKTTGTPDEPSSGPG